MTGNGNFRRAGQGALDSAVRDAAKYLDSPEMISTYLKVAFEENDAALIRTALNDVARAKGMASVAAESKITRQALCKALGPNANMTLEKLLGCCGQWVCGCRLEGDTAI